MTNIGDCAFCDCNGLTDVTIPDGVTNIGCQAFYNCRRLKNLEISDNVTIIGDEAFRGCDGLSDADGFVVLRNVLHYYCGSDGTVAIPNNVTRVGSFAFFGCGGLMCVTIPDSVTSIGRNAFSNCSGLTHATISGSITNIGDYVFYDCSELTDVTIPKNVTSIGMWTFYNCRGLTSITIPDRVASIGIYAFNSCYGLTNITFMGNAPTAGNKAFNSINSSCVASVSPKSTGWGVGVGEKWNGLTLQYWPEALTAVANDSEVDDIVATFADTRLAAHVSSVAEYDAFRAWVNGNNLYQPTVVDSKNTWLSYALGADNLIGREITSNDVQIVSFSMNGQDARSPSAYAATGETPVVPVSFAFEVAIDGVNIGGGSVAETVLKENLKKVLGIEGATSLVPSAFSSDNIDITFDTPVDGKAKFTVTPPNDAGSSFFMRVKVK